VSTTLDDRRIAEWLFLLTFAAAAYFYGGAGWSQNATFDVTRAIVERHTFAIDAYAANTGDRAFANGHVYANKAPALAVLAAIPYALLHAILGTPQNAIALAVAAYLCTLLTVGIFAALIPALLYQHARRNGVDPMWAATVAITIALATELLPYSTVMMFTLPSGALMLIAYTSRRPEAGGFAAGLATAMNYLCAPAIVFFAMHHVGQAPRLSGRSDRRGRLSSMLRFIAGAVPPLIALAVYQRVCFGSFFATSIAREDSRFLTKGAALGVFGRPSIEALYGITVSPYRGLFFFAPVLLLALVPLVRERAIAAVSLVFFAANVCFNGWEAGFGVGARYLVPLIPLWGVAFVQWGAGASPPGRRRPTEIVVALAAISFAINFTATAVDPQPSATIPRPLTQYLLPLLIHGHFSQDVPITPPWSAATFTGHTSVNRMAHDEAIVFQRHPPGSLESEWSSFNLGEPFFGAGDARSLIPIVLLLAGGAAAILARARRVSRSSATTESR
jgi:hypothetical protein